MRYLFLAFCFMLTHSAVSAQIIPVPELVKEVFSKQYPDAKEVKWTGGLDNFTAKFTTGNKQLKASYGPKADWVWTETQIQMEELPAVVKEGFKNSKYKDWTVKEIVSVEKPRVVANEYKIVVQKSMINKRLLVFDAKGRLYDELLSF